MANSSRQSAHTGVMVQKFLFSVVADSKRISEPNRSNDQHDLRRIAIELMSSEPKIPIASQSEARRFAIRLGIFYAAMFGLAGAHLPFFPVWLKAVGIDAAWIGTILAVPALTRFTVLPFVTSFAERRRSLRLALIVTALLTAAGFAVLGWVREAIAIFVLFALTACVWTPILPLTDAYALQGVARYRLHYGPLRLCVIRPAILTP